MKKSKILLIFLIGFIAAFSFWSCATTEGDGADAALREPQEPQTEVQSEEVALRAPQEPQVESQEPEPIPDPPNIVFAKQLKELLDKGDVKGAIKLFDDIPAELKDDLDLKLVLASLYVSDGNYDMAIKVADQVLAVDPSNLEALEIKTLCAKAKGDNTAYKAAAKAILATDPYNAQINIMEGDEQALNHKWKLARDAYAKALKSEPENTDALYGYAKMTYYMDDLKLAKTTTQAILDKDPENPEALALMGKLAAEDFNYVRAIKLTQDALMYDPDNYNYYLDMGTYYRYQGKYSESIKCWTKATEILPDYFLAYAYLAGIYDEQNKFEEALQNYRMVIKTNPDYYYAYESTAILEYHYGNYKYARALFDQAYSYSESWAYKLMNIAMYLKEGDKNTAKKEAQALMKKLDRESAEYSLVRLYVDTYSKNAETTLVNKINKEDNNNKKGKMLFYMGLFYEINGSMESAREYYAKVTAFQAPMFFEYRIAEWGLGL
ncbi:MAG: tetratricopeptide repeat protein [Treponema sp.]|nr:tetratricopeptide repeat protein [Treponema sp.]